VPLELMRRARELIGQSALGRCTFDWTRDSTHPSTVDVLTAIGKPPRRAVNAQSPAASRWSLLLTVGLAPRQPVSLGPSRLALHHDQPGDRQAQERTCNKPLREAGSFRHPPGRHGGVCHDCFQDAQCDRVKPIANRCRSKRQRRQLPDGTDFLDDFIRAGNEPSGVVITKDSVSPC